MSYEQAMQAAGAEVILFEEFGSYQGDWFALVSYEGKKGWVHGSYGSCSGCDAFQCEFDWRDEEKEDYQDRLAAFGRGYLDEILTQEEALKEASQHIEWDADAIDMVNFLNAHASKVEQ